MSARKGARFVPIGMPTICWKTFPAKNTKMLSIRNSSILMMSSSKYLFWSRSLPAHSMLLRDQILYICFCGYRFENGGDKNNTSESVLVIMTCALLHD